MKLVVLSISNNMGEYMDVLSEFKNDFPFLHLQKPMNMAHKQPKKETTRARKIKQTLERLFLGVFRERRQGPNRTAFT
jgi:hypothetical protein